MDRKHCKKLGGGKRLIGAVVGNWIAGRTERVYMQKGYMRMFSAKGRFYNGCGHQTPSDKL